MRNYYRLASIEGEGLGTAYEYQSKRRILDAFFSRQRPKTVLIAGLPEKYGFSLDLIQHSLHYGCSVTVADERADKIQAITNILRENTGLLSNQPELVQTEDLSTLPQLEPRSFDVVLNSEVLQRILNQSLFFDRIFSLCRAGLFFTPNHSNISCLSSFNPPALSELTSELPKNTKVDSRGFADMPPFPSGMLLSNKSREKITENNMSKPILSLLKAWNTVERLTPTLVKKKFSHIAYFSASNV